MDVSVIIPMREKHQYLGSVKETLRHLHPAYQMFSGSYEVFAIDNGSATSVVEYVSGCHWVKYYKSEEGANAARELGRQEASGRILACIDADTRASSSWLQTGIRHFEDPTVVAVTGSYDFHDTKDDVKGRMLDFGASVVSKYIYPVALRLSRGIMIGGNCFIRAETLEAICGFNTGIKFWGDDTDTAVRLAKKGKIVYDRDLFVRTSARRYYEDGIVRTLWGYTFHAARASSHALHERPPILQEHARS